MGVRDQEHPNAMVQMVELKENANERRFPELPGNSCLLCQSTIVRSSNVFCVCLLCMPELSLADGGELGAWAPLAPKIFSKSCSFQVMLMENSCFEQIKGSGPLWGQNSAGPLKKILA